MFCKFCGKTLNDAIPFCTNCRQKYKKQTAKKDLEHLNYISVLLTGKPVVEDKAKPTPQPKPPVSDKVRKHEKKKGLFSKLLGK